MLHVLNYGFGVVIVSTMFKSFYRVSMVLPICHSGDALRYIESPYMRPALLSRSSESQSAISVDDSRWLSHLTFDRHVDRHH